MADKLTSGIVNGPNNYFHSDGNLYAPGTLVHGVDEKFVGEGSYNEKVDGKTVKRKFRFSPADGNSAFVGKPSTSEVGSGVDRQQLNVTDFLKGGPDDIEKAINDGNVDDFLSAIEQAEIAGKGRKGIKAAISARLAAKHAG